MNISQGPHHIDDTLTFSVTTHAAATGALTDADAVPAYRVYEDETGTAILTGNMAKLDDTNTTGFYSEQITLSAANGFEVGKSYNIYVTAAVSSVTGATSGGFKVHAPIATQASVDTIDDFLDTEIAAIKAKTDNLPSDPADASDIASSFGTVNSTLATIAGYLDTEVAAILADTNELQTDLANGGRLDLLIDAIKAKTDNLPSDPADASDIADAISGLNDLAAADIRTAIGLASANLDTQLAAIDDYLDTEIAAILADTNELQTDLTNGGRLDLLIDAIKAKTDALPSDPADASDISAAITALNDLSAADIRTAVGLASANLDTQLAALPTAAEIAAQVWEEDLTDHSGTAGSTAEALGAAGSAGDPWSTALPGAYSAGTAGKIIGDNINATISSRATQTSVDTIDDFLDTEVAAIKAKTDNLPTDPADQSSIEAAITAATSPLATAAALAVIDDFLDTEIAAIKAKTDNLPSDPADQSAVEAAITAATSPLATATALSTVDDFLDTEIAAIKAKTDNLPSDPADASDIAAAIAALNNLSAADIRTAVGLASANLDTQLADLPTTSELSTALAAADDAVLAAIANISGGANASAIADAVWDEALSGHTTSGTSGQILGNLTLAAIADQVWDEATSGHTTTGTTGKALADAGSAGDPWETTIGNGSTYSAGQAGQLLSKLRTEVANSTVIVLPNDPIDEDICHLYGQIALPSGRLASSISIKLELLDADSPIKLDSGRPVATREIITRTDSDGYIISTLANGTIVQYQPIARNDHLSLANTTWSITSDALKFTQEEFTANATTLDVATLI